MSSYLKKSRKKEKIKFLKIKLNLRIRIMKTKKLRLTAPKKLVARNTHRAKKYKGHSITVIFYINTPGRVRMSVERFLYISNKIICLKQILA